MIRRCMWMLVGVVGLATAGAARAQQGSGLAFERAAHLKRGLNLSGFFAQSRDYSAARLDAYMSVADMQAIKAMGFDHVRLSINPEPLIREPKTGELRTAALAQLDKTVDQLTGAGLNVILDIHAEETWKAALLQGEDGAARLIAFWEMFAAHYARTDPERVFFEVLNEPSMGDLYRWEGIQDRAVAAIRRVAPRHTIIATAAAWGHQDGLLAMEPVKDDDVIYTFHDYDPMWFTHQGATWSTDAWAYLHGVPYPSTPENVQPVLSEEPDELNRLRLERYGQDRWDAKRVAAEIAAAAAWGAERDVPVYCGEFGAFKDHSDPAARAQWIDDTRTALEANRIGWAMWDYDGNFGLATKQKDASVAVDQAVLKALGLGK
ncbi:MAG: glycoside hydrolase family 5 protein [Acidobacteriaceae bacterium]